jgi:hypothetical protein
MLDGAWLHAGRRSRCGLCVCQREKGGAADGLREQLLAMNDPIIATVGAGLALGALIGYRAGKVLLVKVGGPHSDKPLVRGMAVIGGLLVLGQAIMFFVLIGRNFELAGGKGTGVVIAAGEWGLHFAVTLAVAFIVATCVTGGSFAGTLCARLYEDLRSNR